MTPWGTTPDTIYRPMAVGLNGYYDKSTHTIHINTLYDLPTQRATREHELVHAERGDSACCDPWFDAKQELTVERIAALRLISTADLVEGVRLAVDAVHLAECLDVDLDILHTRIDILTDEEIELLEAVVARLERTA